MTQWDFATDVTELLQQTGRSQGPRTMSQMVQAAEAVVEASRTDPTPLQTWLTENAELLVGQQILVTSVNAHSSPESELPRVLQTWADHMSRPTAAAAVAWLKEEHPALLRSWLLSRVLELVDELLTGSRH